MPRPAAGGRSRPAGDVEWFTDVAPGGRSRLPPFQRHVGQVLSAGDHGARRRLVRLRQRRRSRRLPGTGADARHRHAARRPSPGGPPEDRLYRNDLAVAADGTRTMRFTDVTALSGIHTRGYGMGVAAGDIDNDGWIDLYVTGFGRNQMFRNNGDGTFADVSTSSRHRRPGRVGCVGLVLRLRSRRAARPVRRELPDLQPRDPHSLFQCARGSGLLPPERLPPSAEPSLSESRRRHDLPM